MQTELLERPSATGVDEDLFHGAHLVCQADAPFVTLACGRVANWDERDDQNGRAQCPMCWNADACPICGLMFRRGD